MAIPDLPSCSNSRPCVVEQLLLPVRRHVLSALPQSPPLPITCPTRRGISCHFTTVIIFFITVSMWGDGDKARRK